MGTWAHQHASVAGLGSVAVAAVALGPTPTGVALLLLPAVTLFAVLLLGFAPGAQLLDRLRARRRSVRLERAPRALVVRRAVVARRMTSLAASALAMRPPPLAPSRYR
ncbi:MAG TPA: hypothetical protein VGF63_01195 [Solirubrobacteraceae bacterium]|jgi:hypothetical protein